MGCHWQGGMTAFEGLYSTKDFFFLQINLVCIIFLTEDKRIRFYAFAHIFMISKEIQQFQYYSVTISKGLFLSMWLFLFFASFMWLLMVSQKLVTVFSFLDVSDLLHQKQVVLSCISRTAQARKHVYIHLHICKNVSSLPMRPLDNTICKSKMFH